MTKNTVGKKVLQEFLDQLQLTYTLNGHAEVEINDISDDKWKELTLRLKEYGIENHRE